MLTAKTLFKKKLTKLTIIPLLVVVAVMVSTATASALSGDADSFLKGRAVSGYSDLDGFYALLVGSAGGGLSGFVGCQPGDNNGLSTKYNTLMSDFINDLSSPDASKVADFKTKALKTLQDIRNEYKAGVPADDEICNDIANYAITNGLSYGVSVPTGDDATRLDVADKIAKTCATSLQQNGINGASDTETLILSLSDADYKTVSALFAADQGGSSCGNIAIFLAQHKPDPARQQLNILCKGRPDDLVMIGMLTPEQEAEALKISTGTCSSIESYLQQVTGYGGDAEGDASTGCSFSANPLTWIACPLVGIAEQMIQGVDNFITKALTIDTQSVFDTNGGYYKAWSSFRVLATALLIIGGLVMVVSQALGFEIMDAYTVRKVLPRILVAVIGISLSWPLMRFVVDFFNTVGYDIRNLIYSPFSHLQVNTLNAGALLAVNGAVLGTLFFLGIGAALSLLLTAALAVLIGFVIIIVRDMAIIVLLIMAPIAIACYILPNTQKVWKLWSDNFLGLMMMFPIISAFIAIGKVFSAISLNPDGSDSFGFGSGTVMQIVGFLAYFLPYFLLPIAFRLATGVIGSIAGFVNDRNRGVFDRLKKYRGTRAAENTAAARVGTRFNNRGMNALTSRATTRNFGFGARGRAAYEQKQTMAALEHAKSTAGQAVQHNDPVLRAQTYGSAAEAQARMASDWGMSQEAVDTAIAGAKANGGFGRARQLYAAQQLSMTGTGYDNIEQVAKTIARVSHGNADQVSALAGNINASTKQAGRHDLAPGYGTLNKLAQQESGITTGTPDYDTAHENAWNSASLYQHANDKPQNIKAAIDYHQRLLGTPMPPPGASATDIADVHAKHEKAAIFFNELRSMQPNASGEVKNSIQEGLENNRVQLNALYDNTSPTVLPASPWHVADREGGHQKTQVYDPTTGNYTEQVTPTTVSRETAKQRVERQSRTYERPDPNTLT